MDYQGNFQDMIARYNQELMNTYQRGQEQENPPIPSNEVTGEETRPRYPIFDDAPQEESPAAQEPRVPTQTMPLELGYLQVWVTTASSALPVEGAHVTISHDSADGTVRTAHFVGETDRSGRTEIVPLPAVSAQQSLAPNGDATPFTLYNVEVYADGYYRVENIGVPMYGGVRAIQSVRMVPLPEGGQNGDTLIFEDSGPKGLNEEGVQ